MQGVSWHYSYRNRGFAMPQIDLANVEVIRRLVDPEPFYSNTEGYGGSASATRPG